MNHLLSIPALADETLAETVRSYRRAALSENSRLVLAKTWRAFEQWCWIRQIQSLPAAPETLELYLIHMAETGHKTATIEAARWGVGLRHRLAGLDNPGNAHTVKATMSGIRRTLGVHQRKAAALTIEHVSRVLFPETLTGLRDRALLMVAVTGGFRRSELVALRIQDLEPTEHGFRVFVARSKADQEGEGTFVEIVRGSRPETCPELALNAWLAALRQAGRVGGLFPAIHAHAGILDRSLTATMVNKIVKAAVRELGMDPAGFSGHSPRAGCATYLLDKGVPINVVADHLRHQSVDVTRRYDRSSTAKAILGAY